MNFLTPIIVISIVILIMIIFRKLKKDFPLNDSLSINEWMEMPRQKRNQLIELNSIKKMKNRKILLSQIRQEYKALLAKKKTIR